MALVLDSALLVSSTYCPRTPCSGFHLRDGHAGGRGLHRAPDRLWAGQETGKRDELQVRREAPSREGRWVSSEQAGPMDSSMGRQGVLKALRDIVCPGH